jgi:hypothetical protein
MAEEFEIGAEFEIAHPFVKEEYHGFDEDGPYKRMSWRPGITSEATGPETASTYANGVGAQIITIVSTHKPGKYPARVFFTRRWRDPDGHQFGKTKLRMTTSGALRSICRGYRHEYEMVEPCSCCAGVERFPQASEVPHD